MHNNAIQIKHSVSIKSAFSLIGFNADRKNYVCCPFHSERTPSLKLYPRNNTFYCFGCGATGDVIAFYRRYYGEDFKQAVSHINNDFNLGLNVDKKQKATKEQKSQLQELKRQELARKAVDAEVVRLENQWLKWVGEFNKATIIIREQKPNDLNLTDDFIQAMKNIELYGFMAEQYENELWRFKHG